MVILRARGPRPPQRWEIEGMAALAQRCKRSSTLLIFAGLTPDAVQALHRAAVVPQPAEVVFCPDVIEAIRAAQVLRPRRSPAARE